MKEQMKEIDLQNNMIVPLDAPTQSSTTITMEMISSRTVVHDDGRIEPILVVHFTTGNGHHFYYPWNALKNTVLQWVEIENNQG